MPHAWLFLVNCELVRGAGVLASRFVWVLDAWDLDGMGMGMFEVLSVLGCDGLSRALWLLAVSISISYIEVSLKLQYCTSTSNYHQIYQVDGYILLYKQ